MAALNFPNSPSLNDTHTENGVTFKWNGAAWDRLGDIGAQGATGSTGAQGAAGAQGSTGPVAGSSSQVVYKDGSNNPAGSSSFTFDGTNLTVGGNVSIGGTLTYEDVTNIDSVGVITARAGVRVTGGSVGIGTDNPSASLDVYKNFIGVGAGTYAGRVYGLDSGVNETGVRFVTKGTGDLHNASDAYLMHGITNGTTRFVFGANGNVGIGTDNPTETLTLNHANGASIGLEYSGTENGTINVNSAAMYVRAGTGKHLILGSDGTEKLRITSSGRLSIGNYSSPKAPLHIRGEYLDQAPVAGVGTGSFVISNSDTDYGINFGIRGNGTGWIQQTRVDGTGTNYPLLLNPLGGNIGIGSDSPASTLDVAGTGQFKNNGATIKIESVPGNNYTQVQLKNDGGSFYVGRENNAGNWFATGAEYASVLRSDGSYPVIFRVNGANRFRINPNGDIGIANTSPTSWGSGVPTVEIKGDASSQPTRGGFLGFESYSGTDGYGGLWLDNDQLKFYIGESRTAGDSSYVTPTERLRIAYADYPYIGISTSGTFRDQRLPLSIHGRGFGHGWTQQGTTQDAVYLTAGASGNYSTLTLFVNKNSWGSVAYEIHAAAYSGRHLHRVGGFYQNGTGISGDSGTTTASSSSTFAISGGPSSQQFTMTISGGTWTHPSAWVRLVLSGNGFLRSDLISFAWS